jgi:hypothetical protein
METEVRPWVKYHFKTRCVSKCSGATTHDIVAPGMKILFSFIVHILLLNALLKGKCYKLAKKLQGISTTRIIKNMPFPTRHLQEKKTNLYRLMKQLNVQDKRLLPSIKTLNMVSLGITILSMVSLGTMAFGIITIEMTTFSNMALSIICVDHMSECHYAGLHC